MKIVLLFIMELFYHKNRLLPKCVHPYTLMSKSFFKGAHHANYLATTAFILPADYE
jgi:hypothetical protein